MFKRFIFLFSAISFLGIHLELSAYPLVYLSEESAWYEEGDDVTVTAVLSEPSYLPVIVPFVIDASSTATIKLESADEDNDFYILASDDEDLGYIFSPETASGYLIFRPGQTEKSLDIDVDNDLILEEDETIVFRVVPEEVTVARPLDPLVQTIHILDNDAEDTTSSGDKRVELTLDEQEVDEGRSLLISIAIDSDVDEEIQIYYTIEFETADESDIDLELTEGLSGSITHDGGGGRESFYIFTTKDQTVEAEEEVLYFVITSATGASGAQYPIGTDRSRITIVDNDPTTISWDLVDDGNYLSMTEGEYYQLSLSLSGPVIGDLEVPIYAGGSAVMGTDDDDLNESDFYLAQDLPLTLDEGETSATVTLVLYNDDLVESLENIVLSIGTPTIDGVETSIIVDDPGTFDIDIEDNDPVSINFARENPAYDATDTESEEPYYIPGTEQVVGERNSTLSIPVYLSGSAAGDLTFDVTLDVANSTATLYDPEIDMDEQDWDYSVRYGSTIIWTADEPTHEISLRQGQSVIYLTVYLNDDDESDYVIGEPVPADFENDETIRLSISNIQSDLQSLVLGSATSFTVTIKDLPDIEVTPLFSSLGFDSSEWVDGQPRLDFTTGLFELKLDAVPPASYDYDLTGYQSYKVVIDLSQYDISDPDNPANDPLRTNPAVPGANESFEYYVNTPFVLRYPNGSDRIVLKEGEEVKKPNKFFDENADTVTYASYLLRPLNFPSLEPQYDEEVDQMIHSPGDPFRWTLDFKSHGIATFPVDRLASPGAVRVYLTAEPTTVAPFPGLAGLPIIGLDNLEDGSIRLEVDTSTTSSIQIQYVGEDGIWRIAHPSVISANSSRLFWIDRGPPATITHPSTVDFRVYRVMSSQ